ncbi:MAG: M48 family peptidase [Candidatus Auribacter fodinae]|jgi:predicted metal-dependent hydrolase|uniref:M48 family peptidase n=1 Tax=Candidatus Auribacter fodinae TaxID=2093366 RepID=A0A3A4R818_9BACT|nr:MAG: M48 family peptidase [Candidatus Auribacter fodinae]
MNTIVTLDDIGQVTLIKRKAMRNIRIRITPHGEVIVSMPYRVSHKEALKLVQNKSGWIRAQLDRSAARMSVFTPESRFSTRSHALYMYPEMREDISVRLTEKHITVRYPLHLHPEDSMLQQAVRSGVERAWRKEALEYIPERVAYFADKHNLRYKSVAVRNAKTRWGSCCAKNSINISLFCMRLPDELIDYIILHELAHTVVKSHNRRFWEFLLSLEPNVYGLNNRLKQYTPAVY